MKPTEAALKAETAEGEGGAAEAAKAGGKLSLCPSRSLPFFFSLSLLFRAATSSAALTKSPRSIPTIGGTIRRGATLREGKAEAEEPAAAAVVAAAAAAAATSAESAAAPWASAAPGLLATSNRTGQET